MGGWTSFLFAYVLGGITFIPLVIVVGFVHFYLVAPQRPDVLSSDNVTDDIVQPGDDTKTLEATKLDREDGLLKSSSSYDSDVASGYFAVCREYTPMGINAKPIERSTPVGSTTVAASSPSVYQTMYRSLFERKPAAGPLDGKNNPSQRPKKAGNVFFVVLRHGHLMLFDDEEQLEVRHVVALAHHDLSIYSGGDVTPEGELWLKRNALCLSRKKELVDASTDGHQSKPFYLFSENCSAKEDFYFSLLKNQDKSFGSERNGPKPLQFEVKDIISLVQRLHSAEDHMHTRWLNAMIGRVFLAVHKTRDIESFIRDKLTKKIARVKTPNFLTNIAIRGINTGDSPPFITNPKLRDLTVEGESVVEMDVKYTGNSRIEVAATARLDLGPRFKAREVDLVLAVVLKKLEGHLLVKIKPPPSNRIWISFQTMPKVEMSIEPIVSSRQITYNVILRQIESRIKEVIAETVVLPFWDDMPFFRTEHKTWRGGIFEGDDAVLPDSPLEAVFPHHINDEKPESRQEHQAPEANGTELPQLEKSHSLPNIDNSTSSGGLFGRKFGGRTAVQANDSTGTSAISSSVEVDNSADLKSSSINTVPQSPRSSFGTESSAVPAKPIIDVENATGATIVESLKLDSQKLSALLGSSLSSSAPASQAHSQDHTPLASPAKPPPAGKAPSFSSSSSRERLSESNDENDQPTTSVKRRDTASSGESSTSGENSKAPSVKSQTASLGRNFFRRENSHTSLNSFMTDANKRANTLTAVSNAAQQAKQWGWNALQRHKDQQPVKNNSSSPNSSTVDLNQPMGGGRPFPPVGTPLPGPEKTPSRTQAGINRKPLPFNNSELSSLGEDNSQALPESTASSRRRRRVESEDKSGEDDGDGLFVVAAPLESEPSTPQSEEAPAASWRNDTTTASTNTIDRNNLAQFFSTPSKQFYPEPTNRASSDSDTSKFAAPGLVSGNDEDGGDESSRQNSDADQDATPRVGGNAQEAQDWAFAQALL